MSEKRSPMYGYLLGMHKRGKLTAPRVVAAQHKGWLTEAEADDLMALILDEAGQENQ